MTQESNNNKRHREKETNYFDKPCYVFHIEDARIHADSFDEAYKSFQNQLYMGFGVFYHVQDFHGKELHPKTNIRIITVQGVNDLLIKDEKKKIHLYSKSTGEKIT